MYALAKSAREKMKAKARALAGEKDQKTDSSDWTPAKPLNAEVKTGARPIMRPSAKGIGESNAARDTKAAIGRDMKRGAFKAGGAVKDGGVKDKAALGAIDPSPKRGAAEHYKRGGKAEGGAASRLNKIIGYKSESQKQSESMRDVGKDQTQRYSQEEKGALNRALERNDALPEPGEAAERSGKYQNYKKGGKAGKWIQKAIEKPGALRKSLGVKEGEKIPAKKLAKAAEAPGKLGKRARLAQTLKGLKHEEGGRVERKAGGRAKGKTNINIVIATGQKPPMPGMQGMPPVGPRDGAVPVPVPVAAPPAAAMPPMPPPMPPGAPAMGRKAGGRITKVAHSYKDMQAGAASGEGRLQKTDIAKRHADAPAHKAGGRISKVAKSYKDMTAGAGSGEGRLQKEDIAVAKKARRA